MKVKLEIDIEEPTYQTLEAIAKSLNMKDAKELILRELEGGLETLELWLDRFHIAQTRFPSFFK